VLHVLQKFSSRSVSPKSVELSMLQSGPVLNHDESLYVAPYASAEHLLLVLLHQDALGSDDFRHQDALGSDDFRHLDVPGSDDFRHLDALDLFQGVSGSDGYYLEHLMFGLHLLVWHPLGG